MNTQQTTLVVSELVTALEEQKTKLLNAREEVVLQKLAEEREGKEAPPSCWA